MRVLVPVFIVGIIAVVVLILVLSDRRKTAQREKLARVVEELHEARGTITRIAAEVELQEQASYIDWTSINALIREHQKRTYNREIR